MRAPQGKKPKTRWACLLWFSFLLSHYSTVSKEGMSSTPHMLCLLLCCMSSFMYLLICVYLLLYLATSSYLGASHEPLHPSFFVYLMVTLRTCLHKIFICKRCHTISGYAITVVQNTYRLLNFLVTLLIVFKTSCPDEHIYNL